MIRHLHRLYREGTRLDGWRCPRCAKRFYIDGPNEVGPRWLFASLVLHAWLKHAERPPAWSATKVPGGVYAYYWGHS